MVIDVRVTNRKATLLSEFPYKELIPYWSYFHPNYGFIKKARPWMAWDGLVKMLDQFDTLPAGLFWATKKSIEDNLGIKFRIEASLKRPDLKTENVITSDRDYQNECVEKALKVARFGGGTILAATGSGKTWMAAMLFSRIKGTCCFVVDQLILLEQAREELQEIMGEEIGIVGKGYMQPRRVTVATIQTMFSQKSKRAYQEWARKLAVMIVDEIHDQMNRRNFVVVQNVRPLAVYGLTATLKMRQKDVRIRAWGLAGPVIFEFPLKAGQSEGVLAEGVAVNVMFKNELDKEDMESESHVKAYTDRIVTNDERNRLIAMMVRESRKRGYYTICLVTRVRHLQRLSQLLDDIPHRVVSGSFRGENVEVSKRMLAKDKFEEGNIRVILANTVFKKGVNIKRVDVIIDAAAGSDSDDVIQKFGRGVRLHEEKSGLMYFDVSDYDEKNPKNWFWRGSKKRMRALNLAGIERVQIADNGEVTKESVRDIFDTGEKLLRRRLERVAQLKLEGLE